MKVRAKFGTPTQYEVLEESNNYYVINNINIAGSSVWAAPKSHYEPVPVEPVWRDVTAECESQNNGEVWHMTNSRNVFCSGQAHGYRLRKVEFLAGPEEISTWAFILEKCDAE